MAEKKKDVSTFVRRDNIKKELGITKLAGNDKYLINHIDKLLQDRGGFTELKKYKHLYDIATYNKQGFVLQDFYWWLKDKTFTDIDYQAYLLFVNVVEELGFKNIKPDYFAGKCDWLVSQLKDWSEGSGETEEELLILFFIETTQACVNTHNNMIINPTGILGQFGIELFLEKIGIKYGHKKNILKPSKEAMEEAKSRKEKLEYLTEIRHMCLQEKNVKMYDEIGMEITEKGVDATYERWYNQ